MLKSSTVVTSPVPQEAPLGYPIEGGDTALTAAGQSAGAAVGDVLMCWCWLVAACGAAVVVMVVMVFLWCRCWCAGVLMA